VRRVHALLNTGYKDVVGADLSAHLDSMPHAELMKWKRNDGPLGEIGSERSGSLSAPPVLHVAAPRLDSTFSRPGRINAL
jgi:hypothetical protein